MLAVPQTAIIRPGSPPILWKYFNLHIQIHLPVHINSFHITNLNQIATNMEGTCIHSIHNSLTEGKHACKDQCLLLCFPEKLQQKQSQSYTNLST